MTTVHLVNWREPGRDDAGITAQDAKLAKARKLKQGMMQALLTGRLRLPVEAAA